MYLKELTLRGFKSFASATRFRFEPGITAIVGPNGSGKSNVVDALAWVMGEQGAKSLRGGNMSDVIFAGGTSRGALGRAQVELTIDNSDGRLPIAYSEVTISRTMFRSGGSEYAINRQPVRLLDVQELLSDSGLGRQMHVIVGQGQLDTVLSASPTDRRAFIDEAAGVAKHRRRKERALRKLESMDANLVRVLDLTQEMKAQLKPLARQAKAAQQAEGIQRVAAFAQARLLAADLVDGQSKQDRLRTDLERLRAETHRLEERTRQLQQSQQQLSQIQEKERTHAEVLGERYRDFTELRGRLLGLSELAEERGASASRTPAPVSENSTELASKRADEARIEAEESSGAAEVAEEALEAAVARRESIEPKLKQLQDALRLAEQQQEQLRRSREALARDLQSAKVAVAAREGECAAAADRWRAAQLRHAEAEAHLETFTAENPAVLESSGASSESASYERLSEEESAARLALQSAERSERDAAEELSRTRSRSDTLERSLAASPRQNDRKATPAAAPEDSWLRLEQLLRIEKGWEEAVSAALGALSSARVATSLDTYLEAVSSAPEWTARERGYGGYVLDNPNPVHDEAPPAETETGPVPLRNLVQAPAGLSAALDSLLAGVWACEDEAAALAYLSQRAEGQAGRCVCVTRAGATLGPGYLRLRGEPQSSRLVLLAELEDARSEVVRAEQALETTQEATRAARLALAAASKARGEALTRLRQADAARAAVAQEHSRKVALVEASAVEATRIARQVDEGERRLSEARSKLVAAKEAAQDSEREAQPVDLDALRAEVEAAAAKARAAWEAENQARMDAQVARQKAQSLQHSARAFAAQAQSLREERQRQLEKAERARAARDVFAQIASAALEQAKRAERAAEDARILRDLLKGRVRSSGQALAEVANEVRQAQGQRGEVGEQLLQSEVAYAGVEGQVKALSDRALALLSENGRLLGLPVPTPPGLRQYTVLEDGDSEGESDELTIPQGELWDESAEAAQTLISGYGPHIPWDAPTPAHGGQADSREVFPLSREEAEEAVERTRRQLTRLGVVNPLAVEEYEAASARYQFLEEQVGDLNRSKADLLALIREIDSQVKQAFESAFADTAQRFEGTFSRLFPGGTGRLELTDPDDPLGTGVEIFARPSGKKVTRLSLLSGGERSLAALAYLIAIFQARPSPFYVMDEVEAALDDVNLGRVLSLLEDLRAESQLLVITHQKRTMETADALYGVTMKDGVTAVMSHRMAE